MTSPITNAFPTPIYNRRLGGQEELNELLSQTIRQMAVAQPSHDLKRAHHGGFYSDGTFFQQDLPGVKDVVSLFKASLDEYFLELGVTKTIGTVQLQGWVALTRRGDYQTPHVHRGSVISGVYYVQTPKIAEPEGCIDFITPIDAQEMTFLDGVSPSYCRIQPVAGMLILFPSYLRHFAHPIDVDEERICVVCNAFVQ